MCTEIPLPLPSVLLLEVKNDELIEALGMEGVMYFVPSRYVTLLDIKKVTNLLLTPWFHSLQ